MQDNKLKLIIKLQHIALGIGLIIVILDILSVICIQQIKNENPLPSIQQTKLD